MFDVKVKTQNLSSISKTRQRHESLGEMNCQIGAEMSDVDI